MSERSFTQAEVEDILDGIWRQTISYPWAQVCKHLVACNIISRMEELGLRLPPDEIIRAVTRADDETALGWERGASR